jgi:hypothetical protein
MTVKKREGASGSSSKREHCRGKETETYDMEVIEMVKGKEM